jgi:predicted  nucleic acid-binding Zn-ribbon protein
MRKQLEEMNTELTQYKKSSQALTVMINELKLKIHGLKHEVDNEDEKINQNSFVIGE